ncbi:MAG: integrase [Gammaproteobacteria bacterium]|nr:MAG: integrase [Gammaproteobacteria bacterium]
MSLTDAAIRKAKPREKFYKMFDYRGLFLQISPKGGKWWRFKYRFEGKEKLLSLGVYPDVGLKEARELREEARKQVAAGVNPSDSRKAKKSARNDQSANTFEVVAREWLAKQSVGWVEGHTKRITGRLEKGIFPYIGGMPIADITAPKLLEVIRRIEQRPAVETAHRVLGNCGQIFRYAIATGRAERDPSGDLRGALLPKRKGHFAAVTEPEKVGRLLKILDGYQGTPVVSAALKLAPLVFVRPGELRQAKWENMDLEKAEWRFTVTKTNVQHIVPLAHQSLAILRELELLTGSGQYVFPSLRSPKGDRPMSDNAILTAMRSLGISKEEMSGNGFRAMARTLLDEELGFRPDYIEHQLAHAVRDPNGRAYNRTAHLVERRKMMQEWADYLDRLKAGIVPNNTH